MSETWRVIDESGAEHEATVYVRDGDNAAALSVAIDRCARDTYHRATSIRAAIAHRAWAADIAVAEILAPGQPSRAEVEADAFRRGMEATRAAAKRVCDDVEASARYSSEADVALRCGARINALTMAEVAK